MSSALSQQYILECGHNAISTCGNFGFCIECEQHFKIIEIKDYEIKNKKVL